MNPCHRCGFDKFETHDGLFFCTRCQTQSQVCCDCVNLGVMVVPGTVAIFPCVFNCFNGTFKIIIVLPFLSSLIRASWRMQKTSMAVL